MDGRFIRRRGISTAQAQALIDAETAGDVAAAIAAAAGAFALNIGVGPLKALSSGQWADVEYTGSAWILTASGSL